MFLFFKYSLACIYVVKLCLGVYFFFFNEHLLFFQLRVSEPNWAGQLGFLYHLCKVTDGACHLLAPW